MPFVTSRRLACLADSFFADLQRKRNALVAKGMKVIGLDIGNPDLSTPAHVIRALREAIDDPSNNRYPDQQGTYGFRRTVADWYRKRFQVQLDPETEVLSLIGSKEGIAHATLAFADPGTIAFLPDPGHPIYDAAAAISGAHPRHLPLRRENGFLPDLKAIPRECLNGKARVLWLNYPNNPTGATATRAFFSEVVGFATEHNLIVCHDNVYSEIFYNEVKPLSFLEIPGAREIGLEFHSLSKTYNMAGWRIGFAVGNSTLIEGLKKIKSNVDAGAVSAVQAGAIAALGGDQTAVAANRLIYKERRDILVEALEKAGIECHLPDATFYLWPHVPRGFSSASFAERLLDELGIMVAPGSGFGAEGEGFVRLSLTVSTDQVREAADRLSCLRG